MTDFILTRPDADPIPVTSTGTGTFVTEDGTLFPSDSALSRLGWNVEAIPTLPTEPGLYVWSGHKGVKNSLLRGDLFVLRGDGQWLRVGNTWASAPQPMGTDEIRSVYGRKPFLPLGIAKEADRG